MTSPWIPGVYSYIRNLTFVHTHTHTQLSMAEALSPTPSGSSPAGMKDVVGTYVFADPTNSNKIFGSLNESGSKSWEYKLLVCSAFRQACVQEKKKILKGLFQKPAAKVLYETWRKQACDSAGNRDERNTCNSFLLELVGSMRECRMVKNRAVLKMMKEKAKVDWDDGVYHVSTNRQ